MSTARRVVAALTVPSIPLLLLVASLLLVPVPARAATSAPVARVRIAHLSPDTPALDGYLEGGGQNRKQGDLGYGGIPGYLQIPAGHYTVAVRTKGAPANGTPLVSQAVDVTAGHAYTVALTGHRAGLTIKLVEDDLTEPVGGNAKVRVMQAADRASVGASLDTGATLASGLTFGAISGYQQVPAGRFGVRVTYAGGAGTDTSQRFNSDKIYSMLVLDGAKGSVVVRLHVDAPDTDTPLLSLPGAHGSGSPLRTPSFDTKGLGPALLAAAVAVVGGLGLPRVLAWRKKRKK